MNCFVHSRESASVTPRIHVKIVTLWRIKVEDRIERNVTRRVVGKLMINEASEGIGVSHRTETQCATTSLQHNDTFLQDPFTNPLVYANRGHVAKFDRASLVVQHAAFDNDSLGGKVHLSRAPSPRARHEHDRAGPGEDQ